MLIAFVAFSQTKSSFELAFDAELSISGIVTVFGRTVGSADQTSSSSSSSAFNVWSGVGKLWSGTSYVLATFVALWSGVWPYFKLVSLGIGLLVYRSRCLPRNYGWLSFLGHYSFIGELTNINEVQHTPGLNNRCKHIQTCGWFVLRPQSYAGTLRQSQQRP